jgi:hypothetical protein
LTALFLDALTSRFRRIESDHPMSAAQQPLRHIGAHPTETDHRKFHSVCLEAA